MGVADGDLQHFIDLVFRTIEAGLPSAPDARPMVDAAARQLAVRPEPFTAQSPGRLPVCGGLDVSLQAARMHGTAAAMTADAFAALEPGLEWRLRAGAAEQGQDFLHGHANAVILGHVGYSAAAPVTLGVSFMASGVTYPDHAHPPEELYVVLSPGRWRQDRGPWRERGVGELVHNPPGINHGMQSVDAPLLALWLLWSG